MKTALGLGAALALYAALALTSLGRKSATFDECAHLPAAYTHLALGDYRLSPDHPPLVKHLAALPLVFGGHVNLRTDDSAFAQRRQWEFGRRFLYRWNDADTLFRRSRSAMVVLGAGLGAAVFFWTRRLFGARPAALALLLCVLNPEVLAHGQLVTTDLGAALFIFLSVAAFERVTERISAGRLALAGAALGAALATKFSALVLLPVLAVLGAVVVLSPAPLVVEMAGIARRRVESRRGKMAVVAALLAVMVVLATLVIWASYGFHARFTAEPEVDAAFEWERLQPESAVIAEPVLLARRLSLLPDPYLFGFFRFFKHSESRPEFLLGRRSEGGSWYYFLATFAMKTPLALIALLALALATRARAPASLRAECFVWLPVVVYLAMTATRGINIGHRHLLPIYPFLFVAAGRAAAWAFAVGRSWRSAPALAGAALVAWHLGATLWIHPHYLAYFNELAGGPSRGYRLLADSNLDWGQDLKGLGPISRGTASPLQALLLRHRRSRVPRHPVRAAARLHAAAPAQRGDGRAARRPAGHQRHQPAGRLSGAGSAAAHGDPARARAAGPGGLLHPHLSCRLRVGGALMPEPGEFCWVQLTTTDAGAACDFYAILFGWRRVGGGRLQLRGKDVAGLYEVPAGPAHWSSYVAVASVEAAMDRARELGGEVVGGPLEVPGSGLLAVVRDPVGAVFSLWESRGAPLARLRDEPGTVCRHELLTSDLPAAEAFYSGLFGWRAIRHTEGWHTNFSQGDRLLGGALALSPRWGVPACWMPVFAVGHCDASVDLAAVLGGRVVMDTRLIPVSYGYLAILSDGQGAPFALLQPFIYERTREIERRLEDPRLTADEVQAWIQDVVARVRSVRRNSEEKIHYAKLLGRLGERLAWLGRVSPPAFVVLSALLEDPSTYDDHSYDSVAEWVSDHAKASLISIGPLALPVLVRALGSPRERTRGNAGSAIVYLHEQGAPAVEALVRALESPPGEARGQAAWALGQIGPAARDAADALERRATLDPSPDVRGRAAQALATVLKGDPELRERTERMLDATDARQAGLIVAGSLSHQDRAALAGRFTALLSDEDPAVRLGAAEHLVTRADDSASVVSPLIELLSEDDPAIRARAVRGLGSVPEADDRMIEALIASFQAEYERERRLGRSGGRDELDDPYRSAVEALQKFGRHDPRVAAALFRAVVAPWPGDPAPPRSHWYRAGALRALGQLDAAVILPHVPGLLAHRTAPDTLEAFANALVRVLGALGEDAPPEAAKAVGERLDQLAPRDPALTGLSWRDALDALTAMGKAARPALDALDRASAHRHEPFAHRARQTAVLIRAAG